MKHTPTPWRYNRSDGSIATDNFKIVCRLEFNCSDFTVSQELYDTAFILGACNKHDELIETLKTIIELCDTEAINSIRTLAKQQLE